MVRPVWPDDRGVARGPWGLVRSFAWRSALAFVLAGAGLTALVSSAVHDHFQRAAAFHAEFVAHAVVEPLLAEIADDRPIADVRDALGERLSTYVIDEHVVRILLWDASGTVVAADDAALVGATDPGYLEIMAPAGGDAVHEPTAAGTDRQPPGGFVVDGPLRSFVWLDTEEELVAEILQDPAPTLAGASALTRLIGFGLAGGLVVLWGLSLPIARRASRDLDRRAHTDDLTGLLNRAALADHVDRVLGRAAVGGDGPAVLFVDLDGFKSINDLAGHAAGDEVIRQVADRLVACVRDDDVVARFAGDEFVVVLPTVHDLADAEHVANRMLEEINAPFDGLQVPRLTASIGVSAARGRRADIRQLVRDADAAMYDVKESGGRGVCVFDDELREIIARRQWIDREIRGAHERGELHLVVQPFVALQGDAVGSSVAAEALLRWTHPSEGPVGPAEFIDVAERNGVIRDIGAWVLAEGCALVADWQRRIPKERPFRLFLNLSPVQLTDELPRELDRLLASTGADPAHLGFEVTESALHGSDGDGPIAQVLEELRARGCAIAVDDFGTGYSSLSRLRTLPIDILKLDASFVRSVTTDRRELAITTAVASIGQRLGIAVVAEGVETAEQLVFVRTLGIDLVQGFHLVRPGLPDDILRYFTARPAAGRPVNTAAPSRPDEALVDA
ncbi:MAG: EAL domain-containing protein [Nitriliruptoraceae bacterium]